MYELRARAPPCARPFPFPAFPTVHHCASFCRKLPCLNSCSLSPLSPSHPSIHPSILQSIPSIHPIPSIHLIPRLAPRPTASPAARPGPRPAPGPRPGSRPRPSGRASGGGPGTPASGVSAVGVAWREGAGVRERGSEGRLRSGVRVRSLLSSYLRLATATAHAGFQGGHAGLGGRQLGRQVVDAGHFCRVFAAREEREKNGANGEGEMRASALLSHFSFLPPRAGTRAPFCTHQTLPQGSRTVHTHTHTHTSRATTHAHTPAPAHTHTHTHTHP